MRRWMLWMGGWMEGGPTGTLHTLLIWHGSVWWLPVVWHMSGLHLNFIVGLQTHTHTHAKTPCGQHRLSIDDRRHFTITPHSLILQPTSLFSALQLLHPHSPSLPRSPFHFSASSFSDTYSSWIFSGFPACQPDTWTGVTRQSTHLHKPNWMWLIQLASESNYISLETCFQVKT